LSVHRLRKYNTADPFTRVPNAAVNDPNLDLKARGLLLLMLSKPDGWTFRERNLADAAGVGREQLRTAMQTLIRAGYVVRTREAENGNPPVCVTTLYDTPEVGNPEVGKPDRRETRPISNEGPVVTNDPIAAAPRERKPDPLWDTMLAVCGIDPATLTRTARGAVNKALKELREIGATPADLEAKAAAYRKTWPGMSLTPTALVKHWAQLATKADTRKRTCECGQPFDKHLDEFHTILMNGGL